MPICLGYLSIYTVAVVCLDCKNKPLYRHGQHPPDSTSSSSSSSAISRSVLKTLNINGKSGGGGINNLNNNRTSTGGDVKAEEGDDNKEGRTVLIPVDSIVANLKR